MSNDPIADAAAQQQAQAMHDAADAIEQHKAAVASGDVGLMEKTLNAMNEALKPVDEFAHKVIDEITGHHEAAEPQSAAGESIAPFAGSTADITELSLTSASLASTGEAQPRAEGEPGEPSSSPSSVDSGTGEAGNGAPIPDASKETSDASATSSSPASEVVWTEHPHTTILRTLTTTLRRKFNLFDGELEAILKDAESHL